MTWDVTSMLAYGDWGLRIKGDGVRLSELTSAEEVIKRKIKAVKGTKVYLRVFPNIPVCIKGNETRMGKGKVTFKFWATQVPTGRVIFEIGVLRQAGNKLPIVMEFIDKKTPPLLRSLLLTPEVEEGSGASSSSMP
ncbi:ribosomal protein L10e/L16 [Lactarius quietus]|nr:ribosomal protein L10e/L16 [Lactarius quietus]